MNSYTEFFDKAQTEFLNGVKQAQALNVKTLTETVERSLAFSNELLNSGAEYLAKLTEAAASSAKLS